MLDSTDTLLTERTNNTTSTQSARQSDLTTGRTMPWKSNPMEDMLTLDSLLQSTQDGGNSSDSKLHTL